MKTEYQYLFFINLPSTGKTLHFSCRNKNSGIELGEVKWYGAWRQYCYFPATSAVYSEGCLKDIADFITQLKNG